VGRTTHDHEPALFQRFPQLPRAVII